MKAISSPSPSHFDLTQSRQSLSEQRARPPHGKKKIGDFCYKLKDCIGSGYSSHVYKGFYQKDPHTPVAIKVINLRNLDKVTEQLLQNQITILKQLNHPNLLKLHNVFFTPNNCYLITDYCSGGTLQNYIETAKVIDWKNICLQLVQGLQYLAQKSIIHRDLKPANIFLTGDTWVIGDFGFARFLPRQDAYVRETFTVGSPLYMPPQTLQKKIYSLKTDSFALGIMLFYLVTHQFPWQGNNKRQLLQEYSLKRFPCEKLSHLPADYGQFIKGLCEVQFLKRQSALNFKLMVGEESNPENKNFIKEIEILLQSNPLTLQQKTIFCSFIQDIDQNIQHFDDMRILSENLRTMLKTLHILFRFGQETLFNCHDHLSFVNQEQIEEFCKIIHEKQQSLVGSSILRCQILMEKLGQLNQAIKDLIKLDIEGLKNKLGTFSPNCGFSTDNSV